MPYIDRDYIEGFLTSDLTTELFPDQTTLDRFLGIADSRVTSACQDAGYLGISPTSPPSTTDGVALTNVKLAALFVVYVVGMAMRKGLAPNSEITAELVRPSDIREGKVKLPGVPINTLQAVGGGAVASPGGLTLGSCSGPVATRRSMGGW